MKQMLFGWPFWTFWLCAALIIGIVALVLFLWPYPRLLDDYLPSRRGVLRLGRWVGWPVLSGSLILLFLLFLPTAYSCSGLPLTGKITCPAGKNVLMISIGGSTALDPFISTAITKYKAACPTVQITNMDEIMGSQQLQGSLQGLQSLSQGTNAGGVNIATSDVFVVNYAFDPNDYQDYQIGIIKYVVIVNKSQIANQNMPSDLSTTQLRQIYLNGDDAKQTWSAYGGPPGLQVIPYARNDQSSGTELTFRQHVIDTSQVAVNKQHKEPKPQDIIQAVETTKGAIGYISSYDWTKYGDPTKAQVVTIDGYSDDRANIESNLYPFWNIGHVYIQKGNTNPAVTSFIHFLASQGMLSDLSSLDYIQLTQMQQSALQTRCP